MVRWNISLPLVVSFTLLTGQALPGEPPPKASASSDHYGDPLPPGARFRLGSVRLRHDAAVKHLVWLPDGRTLASAGMDDTVRLWKIPGGKQLAKWDSEGFIFFSPDGRTFACAGNDEESTIRHVDIANGKELRRTKHDYSNLHSPDGKIRAVAKEKGVGLYAADSGKKLRFLEGRLILSEKAVLTFSPEGRTLVGATENGLCCWTISTGAKHYPLGEQLVYSFSFSPDGKTLAAVINGKEEDNFMVTLRSWPMGKELHRLAVKDEDEIAALAFSPDGKFLAAGGYANVHLWNAVTGKPLCRFEGHGAAVQSLAFSPDGSLLASAGYDNTVIVWEVDAGKAPRPLTGVGHWLELVGLAADRQTLLTRSAEGALLVWDARDGRRLRTLADGEGGVDKFLFGPEVGRKRVLLQQEWEKARDRPDISRERISCSAFSPDSTMMAVGGTEGVLLLRKTAKGIERRLLDDENRAKKAKARRITISASALTFSPDGRTLASCVTDGRLFLWDSRTGRPRHILSFPRHGESYQCLQFSPDGRLLALSDRAALYLVEAASGQRFRERLLGQDWIDALAFAPDNRTLALGDAGPHAAIHLWDLPTDKEIHTLRGHQYSISKFVFSPDGTFLLSGSDDHTVLSWDIAAILRHRAPSKDLSPTQLTALWTDLTSKDATRAQRAVAELIQAPNMALPFLEKSLPPVSPAKMVPIAALIADLDHEQFARREKASKELEKIGEDATPALRKVLKEEPSLEVRKRITALLEAIDEQPPSRETLRMLRAVQVLETIGTPKAKEILEGLSRGAAEARRTEEAKAALQRLARRSEKP